MSALLHLANLVASLGPHRESFGLRRTLFRMGGVTFGPNPRIANQVAVFGSHLTFGCNVFINSGTAFHSCPEGPIAVGDNVTLAPRCLVISGSHRVGPPGNRAGSGCGFPITIGSGCWLGANVTVLGGASIGAGSVVAAGALVMPGQYPANSLLAGVPAVVKRRIEDIADSERSA